MKWSVTAISVWLVASSTTVSGFSIRPTTNNNIPSTFPKVPSSSLTRLEEGKKTKFAISSLFGNAKKPKPPTPKKEETQQEEEEEKAAASTLTTAVTAEKETNKEEEQEEASTVATTVAEVTKVISTSNHHPSSKVHISPLNLLANNNNNNGVKKVVSSLPSHPKLVSGVTETGLSYVILPNKSPEGRFEAHLQVFSGSADELLEQQGIAHLTEHVAYMGSRKRERLFGTGSQTNAYTDFHHTVFYAACPTYTPSGGGVLSKPQPMMPMALEALADVMDARVDTSRLEKERQAVLSEMTMVNTIEYRVECQILSTLHRENRLAKRFPIGKETLIRSWNREDVKTWHRTHYRPDNVLLYIVGDIDDTAAVEKLIAKTFGHITADKQGKEIPLADVKPKADQLATAIVQQPNIVKAQQSWHYPPVQHEWCVPPTYNFNLPVAATTNTNDDDNQYDLQLQDTYPMEDVVELLHTKEVAPGKKLRPHIFRHELLQAFSLHLFAKRPVEPIVSMETFQQSLARRVALAALQIRLNVGGRSDDPAFTFVEFNQLDSAREGCAVCSLDMTAEPHRWKDAICKSLSEIRKLGLYGVTSGEMERYASALLTDAEQLAAQGDRMSHGDQLSYLMETIANNHVFMSPEQSYEVTKEALASLTLEQVNQAARDLCSHIVSFNDDEEPCQGTVIATACCPKDVTDEDSDAYVSEASLVQTIYEACQIPVEPEEDVHVPHTLVSRQTLQAAMDEMKPTYNGGSFTDGTPNTPADKLTRPFTLRRLASNGMRVNVAMNPAESQRGHLRMVAPGGRDAEVRLGLKKGSMAVGARAMQEGGAFGEWTREQVELFCVDHLLMVEINCQEESLTFDFTFPTTNVGNIGFGENIIKGITGTEATLQIVREIIQGFHWEQDALGRSQQSYRTAHESMQKSLEGKSTELLMATMTSNDTRFLSMDVDTVNAVTLDDAKSAVMSQLLPNNIEISMAGDFDPQQVLDMTLEYLGTIPSDTNREFALTPKNQDKDDEEEDQQQLPTQQSFNSVPKLPLPAQHLELELPDPDPRAVSYVAGAAPNAWGFLQDGSTVAQLVAAADKRASEYDKQRRQHPLFAHVALLLISEIINRRLFSTVRERKQLTYDANFSFTQFERLAGGYFLVTVTASQEKAQKALEACQETLLAVRTNSPVTPDNLESAKRVVMNRHEGELRTSSYWASNLMSGLQDESVPLKGPLSVTDFYAVIESITTKDLQLVLETSLNFDDPSQLYSAIGRTVLPKGYVPPTDEVVKASPMAGMSRGGALMG